MAAASEPAVSLNLATSSTTAPAPADRATALAAYARRAEALRFQALTQGRLDYHQVLAAAYAPGVLDAATIAAKAEWRSTVGGDFVFLADYQTGGAAASVHELRAEPDQKLQSTLVARYESTTHEIAIAAMAPDFVIFHEAGHATQRAALRARGSAAPQRVAASRIDHWLRAAAAAATAEPKTISRLRYLASQDEFEVRLQDLNRFHALLVAGRPIMNAADSVRALAALGMPLSFGEVQVAFARGTQTITREEFDACVAVDAVPVAQAAVAFEDARELLLLRALVLQTESSVWPRLLAKIILEAPGHL